MEVNRMVFGGLLWLVSIVCMIWVIYDVVKYQKKMDDVHKIVWIVCAILFNIITAIVYYFVIKKK